MNGLTAAAWRTFRSQTGQAYAEYGFIMLVMGIVAIGSLTLMGHQVFNLYHNVTTGIQQ